MSNRRPSDFRQATLELVDAAQALAASLVGRCSYDSAVSCTECEARAVSGIRDIHHRPDCKVGKVFDAIAEVTELA